MINIKYKITSLFSGCGGLDLGFHGGFKFLQKNYARLKFETVYANSRKGRRDCLYGVSSQKKTIQR